LAKKLYEASQGSRCSRTNDAKDKIAIAIYSAARPFACFVGHLPDAIYGKIEAYSVIYAWAVESVAA